MGLKPAKAHNPDSHGLMLLLTGPWLIIYSKILLLTKAINLLIYLQTGWDYRNILEVINKLAVIMNRTILYLLILINLSCNEVRENTLPQNELKSFDTVPAAINQYYFYEWENYRGRLDTCYCLLRHNDSLKIILENRYFSGGEGLIINVFKSKFTGYFYHSNDYRQYSLTERGKLKYDIEIPLVDIKVKMRTNKFDLNDTIEGAIWATSNEYFDNLKVRDRFEGRFKCIVTNASNNYR